MLQQQRRKKLAVIAIIAGAVIAGLASAFFAPMKTELTELPIEDKDLAQSIDLARNFVISGPTFSFDGIKDSVDVINPIESLVQSYSDKVEHRIHVAFDSAHAGYGNRADQVLAEVITHHTAEITISDGKVVSAIIDDTWDEVNHQYVLKKPSEKLPSHNEPVTPFDGEVIDYSSLVDAVESKGILVESVEEMQDSMFSAPVKVISVGGADVQVFEFQNESDVQVATDTVSEDGTEIGTSVIRWIDTPHFYAKGKIIVLYVGQNPEITSLLESLLGNQFAGM